jgi:hypothetical protein
MDTQIARLTQALVLAITAPDGREADADALVQQLARGMTPDNIDEAKRHALSLLEVTA